MKKIGLLSDTHGHWDDRYIKYFSNCDEIWHAGDIGDIQIMDQLKKITKVRGVYGNIDNHIIRAEYPLHQKFVLEKINVWITHIGGSPYRYIKSIRNEIYQNPPKLFICGHSHICKVQLDRNLQMLYMNPGAAGIKGIHKVRTILKFNLDNGDIKGLEVIELGKR